MCTPGHATKANGILAISLSYRLHNVAAGSRSTKVRVQSPTQQPRTPNLPATHKSSRPTAEEENELSGGNVASLDRWKRLRSFTTGPVNPLGTRPVRCRKTDSAPSACLNSARLLRHPSRIREIDFNHRRSHGSHVVLRCENRVPHYFHNP
jgi:hypothetical protein